MSLGLGAAKRVVLCRELRGRDGLGRRFVFPTEHYGLFNRLTCCAAASHACPSASSSTGTSLRSPVLQWRQVKGRVRRATWLLDEYAVCAAKPTESARRAFLEVRDLTMLLLPANRSQALAITWGERTRQRRRRQGVRRSQPYGHCSWESSSHTAWDRKTISH